MNLTDKQIAEILLSSERMDDVKYAVQNLEDYFRSRDIDLYWFSRKVEDLCESAQQVALKDHAKIRTIMDIANINTIEQLELLVLKGLKQEEYMQEQIETLLSIKQDLADVYTTLIKSLP